MDWAEILERARQQRRDLQKAYDVLNPPGDSEEMSDVRRTAERLRPEIGLRGDPTSVVPGISPR